MDRPRKSIVEYSDIRAVHTPKTRLFAPVHAGNELQSLIHRITLLTGRSGSPQVPKCVSHVLRILCKLSVDKLTKGLQSGALFPFLLLSFWPGSV